jgi:peptidoglycan hydrolase-like protein with peptidoglycan-binding domain
VVVSTTPANGTQNISPTADIVVNFSAPLSLGTVMPTISPAINGSWVQTNQFTLTFSPASDFMPSSTVTLTVPGGKTGVLGSHGQELNSTFTASWTISSGSVSRLQQLLGQLGYLPVTFKPASSAPISPLEEVYPQFGSFSWAYANVPTSLASLWQLGSYNVMTRGAVMAFEHNNGLPTDGIAGPKVWAALLADVLQNKVNTFGYSYVMVSKLLPETLQLWHNGQIIFTTLVNTGISVAPTADGTFPVYLRYRVTTMSGYNPNGTYYHDTGIPWTSYFNGGDALHGYIRASYGWPQSLGCVEMSFASAGVVWPWTPIGTLVTVS